MSGMRQYTFQKRLWHNNILISRTQYSYLYCRLNCCFVQSVQAVGLFDQVPDVRWPYLWLPVAIIEYTYTYVYIMRYLWVYKSRISEWDIQLLCIMYFRCRVLTVCMQGSRRPSLPAGRVSIGRPWIADFPNQPIAVLLQTMKVNYLCSSWGKKRSLDCAL